MSALTLGQEFGHMPGVIGLYRSQALRHAAERLAAVQIRVVIDLHERFERDTQALAIAEHAAVVVGQPPWSRIDVEAGIEAAFLRRAAQFRIGVAAAQGPVSAAG